MLSLVLGTMWIGSGPFTCTACAPSAELSLSPRKTVFKMKELLSALYIAYLKLAVFYIQTSSTRNEEINSITISLSNLSEKLRLSGHHLFYFILFKLTILVLGPHLAVFRGYFWLCLRVTLAVLRNPSLHSLQPGTCCIFRGFCSFPSVSVHWNVRMFTRFFLFPLLQLARLQTTP